MVMEDGLWSNCPELRRKRIPATGRSNHERTVGCVLDPCRLRGLTVRVLVLGIRINISIF